MWARSPGEFRRLLVPSFRSVSRGDPVQASLPPQHKGTSARQHGDHQGTAEKEQQQQQTASEKRDDDSKQNGTEHAQPNYIRAMAISHTGCHVAVCDDRKYLHIFRVDDGGAQCELISSR
ncbi:hypothetical protein ElyMa_003868900 [Elysia marginata]|uniref:Uncharacterized protein n=1 Tax=Elysia marginata TaxID=1093978 RepID=A0AAV4FKB1_9GAST|nr:hypothetical protein ElyMa_003868900 [Elysia marginata]